MGDAVAAPAIEQERIHDGRFATLRDVVDHYDSNGKLGLGDAEKAALVEFLKSI